MTSSVFDLADENIKLIDMLAEDNDDDDFLVTSTLCDSDASRDYEGFRLSGIGTSRDVDKHQQTDPNNHMSFDLPKPSRPSFMRRSLAWDSAFYDCSGVLDPDELSFMNKGLGQLQDVPNCPYGSESTPSNRGLDTKQFKIEDQRPSSSRTRHEILNGVQATKKVEQSNTNKIKSCKEQINATARKRTGNISSPKPPKSSKRMNISTSSGHKDITRNSDVKIKTKSATTYREGNKSATKVIPSLIGSFSTQSSTLSKRQAGQGKNNSNDYNKLSATFPAWKFSGGSLGTRSMSLSTRSLALPNHSCSSSITKKKTDNRWRKSPSIINDHSKKALDLQSNLDNPLTDSQENQIKSSAKQYGPRVVKGNGYSVSGSTNNFRPSQLHPPSPNNRFFDQITPCKHHMPSSISRKSSGIVASSTNTRNILSAASNKKLKTPNSEVFRSSLMLKTSHRRMSKSVAIDRDLYLKSEKISLSSSMKEEITRVALKNRRNTERTQEKVKPVNRLSLKADEENEEGKKPSPEDYKLGNLIRFFEGIELKQDKTPSGNGKSIEESVPFISKIRTRTPLADRNTSGNLYLH